jgi:hypothetical protein
VNGGRTNRILVAPRKSALAQRFLPKRICADAACSTLLSIYNGAAFCSVHELGSSRPGALFRR